MTSVATIRSVTGAGVIRLLRPTEHKLLREHLLRLDAASRRDRFNGGISDTFIESYATRSFEHGAIVVAYLQEGAVRAAAELHGPERSPDDTPEIAFSVEDRLRRQGVGSALFEHVLAEARRRGYSRLRITTGGQNQAMKALAVKFGAHLTFASGEATGMIDLDRSGPSPGTRRQPATTPHGGTPAPLQPSLLPSFLPWGFPVSSLTFARDMVRASQTMWEQIFTLYADLIRLRPRFGTR